MELRHLRYFIAAAEAENVSRAAEKLRVSQPGISRQIHDLEDELGFQLFERNAKSVKLTAAGKKFLTEAKAVLQRADDAVEKARAVAGNKDAQLRVGYAPSLAVRILPQALRIFHESHPKARVTLRDLSTEEMLTGLRDETLHLALMAEPPKKASRDLIFKPLATFSMCAAVSPKHRLAGLKSVSLAEIADQPLIAYSRADYPDYHARLERLFAKAGRSPRIVEEHDGVASLIAAVETGRGIALAANSFDCVAGPRLKMIPLQPPAEPIVVGALSKKKPPIALVDSFVAAASEAV